MAPSPDAFSSLDDSVVIKIFKLLGEPKTRTRLLTVCRRFKYLVAEAGALEWDFGDEDDIERCGEYIARHRLVCKSLKYEFTCTKGQGCKERNWCGCSLLDAREMCGAAIPAVWDSLEVLHMYNPLHKVVHMTRFGLMLNNYQNLRSIDICGVRLQGFRIPETFRNLTSLALDRVAEVDPGILDNVSSLTNLQTLKLHTVGKHEASYRIVSGSLLHLEWSISNSLFLACPSLLTLDARNCDDIQVGGTFPSLKTLAVQPSNLEQFIGTAPHVEQLCLWVVRKNRATGIVQISFDDVEDDYYATPNFRIDVAKLYQHFGSLKVLKLDNYAV